MRILYWADSWWPSIGGIEVLGAQFVRELASRGFEPLVLTSHCGRQLPDDEARDGVRVLRLPFAEAFETRRLDFFALIRRRIEQLKREWRPEIIHLHFPAPSGIFHLQTRDASAAPLLLAMHTHIPNWDTGTDTLSGKLLRESVWLCANSDATLDVARTAYAEISSRSSVIYNGLREPALPPAPLSFDPPIVACIARLMHKKGVDVAIRAMRALHEKRAEVRLIIAGDGPEKARLEHLINDLGLHSCVELRGWIAPEKLHAFLNESMIVVIPSRTMEPFGNVAVEAMQMGRPVVGTRQGGLAELIVEGETGFLVEPDDPAAIADRIDRLALDPALALRMGTAGQMRARSHFSLDRCVDKYIHLYKSLAGKLH